MCLKHGFAVLHLDYPGLNERLILSKHEFIHGFEIPLAESPKLQIQGLLWNEPQYSTIILSYTLMSDNIAHQRVVPAIFEKQ